jgi:hypothetical protein
VRNTATRINNYDGWYFARHIPEDEVNIDYTGRPYGDGDVGETELIPISVTKVDPKVRNICKRVGLLQTIPVECVIASSGKLF